MEKLRIPLLVAVASYWVLDKAFEIVLGLTVSAETLAQADEATVFWLYQLVRAAMAFLVGLGVGYWERSRPWAAGAMFAAILLAMQFVRDLRSGVESTWDDFVVGGLIIFLALAPPFAVGCYITQRLRVRRSHAAAETA